MTDLRVAFRTLGCKLNQLETESIADRFSSAGARIVSFDDGADLYVINTCTVTGKAEQKARRSIRQALASDPHAVVLVTGCYAQMEPQAISALDPRAVVVPGDEKSRVLALAAYLDERWQGHGDLLDAVLEWRLESLPESRVEGRPGRPGRPAVPGAIPVAAPVPPADRFAFHPDAFAFHSRPGLKIQDGCDNRCSYCRVCLARGASVSLAPDQVLARVRALEASGKAEVVLTGVNLSQYRSGAGQGAAGTDAGSGFPDLLRLLHEGTTRIAFRISSYEPNHIDADFLDAFSLPRVRPHLHLALQSGSDTVLARMGRRYDAHMVRAAVAGLRAARRDPFIGADLIAGFPGETDAEFAETLALCRDLDLAWIHAFPFSPRPGTPAWDLRPHIPERVAGERVAALGALARDGKARFAARKAGQLTELVLENGASPESDASPDSGWRVGTSADYLRLAVSGVPSEFRAGQSIVARVAGPAIPPPEGSLPQGADAIAAYAGA